MTTKLLFFFAIIMFFCSCQNKLQLNSFIDTYKTCPDTIITYYSGEKWEGLKQINTTNYSWGLDEAKTKGTITYYNKKGIGKGTILDLDNAKWVVSNLTHKNPPASKGNPNPIPESYDVKLYLYKMCK